MSNPDMSRRVCYKKTELSSYLFARWGNTKSYEECFFFFFFHVVKKCGFDKIQTDFPLEKNRLFNFKLQELWFTDSVAQQVMLISFSVHREAH